ncbi:MAG: TRAP transporter large permease subunit [Rhodospirillales bacterium]|nr:TRAP transporter large permease subunit [Rhodospirillales bacterium]
MEWYETLDFLLGMLVFMMAIGVPVAMAFITVNIIGWMFFNDWSTNAIVQVVDNATILISRFILGPVPMFILMGSLFFHTGLAIRVFDALEVLFGRLPGRLCYLTVAGGTIFSTLTGSSMANTAMLGSLMVPEMRRRGYSPRMSMGPILGTGGLAMIIPPSALGVLLASIAGIDVGKLLIAGLLPGITLALLYAAMITFQLWMNPGSAPAYEVERTSWGQKLKLVCTNILPMSLIVFMVVGFIVLGWATPTEAAALGVLGVLILAVIFRVLTWTAIRLSVDGTIRVAAMVFFILMSSAVFSQLLAFSGATAGMLEWATGFDVSRLMVLLLMFAVLILLGMFMDATSMMLITVPIFFPLAHHLGFDLIWYGLFVLMTIEMAGTTPPFGLLLYVMLGVAPKGTTLFQVAGAAFPFLICDTILILILVAFPALALWLPSMMGT